MQVEASSPAETEVLVPQGDGDGGEVEARGEVVAMEESRVKARRRGGDGSRVARGKGTGMTPRVWRPGRFPRQNPAPAGPKHPCGELPNGLKPRRVENYRVGFQPRENGGTPAGKAASKVGLRSFVFPHIYC